MGAKRARIMSGEWLMKAEQHTAICKYNVNCKSGKQHDSPLFSGLVEQWNLRLLRQLSTYVANSMKMNSSVKVGLEGS